jgi:hypothetical protein
LALRSETVLGHDTAATLRRLAERVEEHRYGPTGEWTEADTEAFTAEAQRFRQAMPTGRSRSASIGS